MAIGPNSNPQLQNLKQADGLQAIQVDNGCWTQTGLAGFPIEGLLEDDVGITGLRQQTVECKAGVWFWKQATGTMHYGCWNT